MGIENISDCVRPAISRLQRYGILLTLESWAAGPGYYISRRWRLRAKLERKFASSGVDHIGVYDAEDVSTLFNN